MGYRTTRRQMKAIQAKGEGGYNPPGEAYARAHGMLTARRLVEEHIRIYGYVPHPDKLKEAIATEIAAAAIGP